MIDFKITREINGETVEITLTTKELGEIFQAVQHDSDLEEIRCGIDTVRDLGDDPDGLLADITDEDIEDMAEELRESIDWGGVGDEICGRRDDIIRQFMDDKRQEREWEGGDN